MWRKGDKSRKTTAANPHVPSHLVGADGNIIQHTDNAHPIPATNAGLFSEGESPTENLNQPTNASSNKQALVEDDGNLFKNSSPQNQISE